MNAYLAIKFFSFNLFWLLQVLNRSFKIEGEIISYLLIIICVISNNILSPAFSLRVITVNSEKSVTNKITRLSTYFKNRVISLVPIFSNVTGMMREWKTRRKNYLLYWYENSLEPFYEIYGPMVKRAHLRCIQEILLLLHLSWVIFYQCFWVMKLTEK